MYHVLENIQPAKTFFQLAAEGLLATIWRKYAPSVSPVYFSTHIESTRAVYAIEGMTSAKYAVTSRSSAVRVVPLSVKHEGIMVTAYKHPQ